MKIGTKINLLNTGTLLQMDGVVAGLVDVIGEQQGSKANEAAATYSLSLLPPRQLALPPSAP